MVFGDGVANTTITVGQVNHVMKSEFLLRCPTGSPLANFVKNLRKGTRQEQNAPEINSRDGHSFAYILHYVITGDLVYPMHEGFHRVDALLKELNFYGLVDDVIRSASQEAPAKGKSSKKNFLRTTSNKNDYQISMNRSSSNMDVRRLPLCKSVSFQNLGRDSSQVVSANVIANSVSMSSLAVENEGQTAKYQSSRSWPNGQRFFTIIKRYLSVKSIRKTGGDIEKQHIHQGVRRSETFGSPGQWNPRQGGVFRPSCAQGATLVLVAYIDDVTVFGQRVELEKIFPEGQVIPLRTTSSAFIDAKLHHQTEQWVNDAPSSLTKRRSELLSRIYKQQIQRHGFTITVQSEWRDRETLIYHFQWLLHKKSSLKNTTARKTYQSAPPNIPLGNSLGRRTSVLQRFFQRNSLAANTSSDISI